MIAPNNALNRTYHPAAKNHAARLPHPRCAAAETPYQ